MSQQCCYRIPVDVGYRSTSKPCTRAGKVERNGKWYCGQHDPQAKAARRQAQNEKWEADLRARARLHQLQSAAPALMEALELALRDIEAIEAKINRRLASGDAARAALAMARGEGV